MTGIRVGANADMKQAVIYYTTTLETEFFHAEIQASLTQWDEVNGAYWKMWWVPSATHASRITRNWENVLGIILLVNLISVKSLHTYTLQTAVSRNFRYFTDKNAPVFLRFMLVFCVLIFNIKVLTFKSCALDHHNYANIKKMWNV